MLDRAGRAKIEKASRLHWAHYLIVALSLVVTVSAWYYTSRQHGDQTEARFDREAERVIDLVCERMQKYEDALWGGVGAVNAQGGDLDYRAWKRFAETLSIDLKYPGINGIGVIHAVPMDQLESYLSSQRQHRKTFHVFPPHDRDTLLPITFVEPVVNNQAAIGLDVAHEANRYHGAINARDSGRAQITGPITLVQDAAQTPGFLFYAPFYRGPAQTRADRQASFAGMVYAPFIVHKLMEGALAQQNRHVSLRIEDGGRIIYDELNDSDSDYDPDPLFKRQESIVLYGRTWQFDIWSNTSFRADSHNAQPLTILIGGLTIDALLLALFYILAGANRSALAYADSATEELKHYASQLEQSNKDLEAFAYAASHDLQEPLRMVASFNGLLASRYGDALDEQAREYIDYSIDGVRRMEELLSSQLTFARLGSDNGQPEAVPAAQCCEQALRNLDAAILESGAVVETQPLPVVTVDAAQLVIVFQNLIANAIKFARPGKSPNVTVSAQEAGSGAWRFAVTDDGIGIETEYHDRIFQMFQRLQTRADVRGSGIGLAMCHKIIARHGGKMWLESTPGVGSTFYFTLPAAAASSTLAATAA